MEAECWEKNMENINIEASNDDSLYYSYPINGNDNNMVDLLDLDVGYDNDEEEN